MIIAPNSVLSRSTVLAYTEEMASTSTYSLYGLPRTLLTLAPFALSFQAFCLGTNGLLRPQSGLAILGLPSPRSADEHDQHLLHGLVRLYGIRNMSIGLAAGLMGYYGQYRALGWYLLGSSTVALVDGVVSNELQAGSGWAHWVFVLPAVALGGIYLGLSERI